jgi:hypothetical protein
LRDRLRPFPQGAGSNGRCLADQQAARGRGEAFDDEAAREKYFPDLEDLNFDDGGRFFMPEDIKGMMGIGETALFVGTGRHIQIWAPEKYLEYKGRSRRVVYAVEQYPARARQGRGQMSASTASPALTATAAPHIPVLLDEVLDGAGDPRRARPMSTAPMARAAIPARWRRRARM